MIQFLDEHINQDLYNAVNLFPASYITIDRTKQIASGGFGDVYRVEIKQKDSSERTYAQKLIEKDLKLLTKDQIIQFFRSVFMETNVMHFISQLSSDRLLKIRGISLDINKNGMSYFAIFTDLLSKDLNQFIMEVQPHEQELLKLQILKQIAEGI